MRIHRVTAHAFGPLRGESLELAPGLTVVSGPNESGKTSWHAALRAAICGVRRGRGASTRGDADFATRHRPWDDADRWEVEARLSLDDGRTIDISQDLAGKVACRAIEVGFGRDVSHEILDGTPDASRWLGLDRDAFAATVCVSQAQILSVADSAAMLQEHMQRAASTRGTDATAAEAIERLTDFRREKVGFDRENARGPLRLARNRLAQARDDVDSARRQHAEYLELIARHEAAEQAANEAQAKLRVADSAVLARDAEMATRRASRAAELAARHPEAPATRAARDQAADQVAAALAAWESRPTPPALVGPAVHELERELAEIPAEPVGDLEAHPDVVSARRELERATDALDMLEGETGGDTPEESPVPRSGPAPIVGLAAAGVLASVGLVLVWVGNTVPAAGLLAAALGLGAWALVAWRRPWAATHRGDSRHRAAALAVQRVGLEQGVGQSRGRLAAALQARGSTPGPDPLATAQLYEAECRARAAEASRAAHAEPLRAAIASRRAAEEAAAQAHATVAAARESLTGAARAARVGHAESTLDELAAELEHWRGARAEAARAAEVATAEWQELQALLSGAPLAELEARAADLSARSERLVEELGAPPPLATPGADLEAVRDLLRERYAAARREADELAGGLEMLSTRLPDVAEAEEAFAAADAELARVQDLAAVLDESLALLRAAQERVHRDLAPVLGASILRWLPRVCAGRYTEVAVEPATLAVSVKEAGSGRWREARLLSEGTREQIYLLLRVAMAQHLATTGETAPLLLDEVTAQSDPERKLCLLEVLHALSDERQVILFSHDADVAAWAERAFTSPEDRLIRLPARGAAAAAAGAPVALAVAG